ncbi:flagellar basal body rod protein FlgB [Gorillibacterium timonense]|uniref:flagellar basal body rod protein FlgB n=1 Tax=Gorillibacterium timonense TaxID=1689269 RepID=UPI00071CF17C|nr:flagellar basal body rod protein FlgB [Gorillibacterium timonense]
MTTLLTNSTFRLLENTLDASSLRQRVLANNLANMETPNFKRSDVDFDQVLKKELDQTFSIEAKRTDVRHISFSSLGAENDPRIVTDETSVMNNNKNNVDVDSEMSKVAENQLSYYTLIMQANYDIKHLRTAIGGRG